MRLSASSVRVLDQLVDHGLQRGHDAEALAVELLEALEDDALALLPAVELVRAASDDHAVADVVVVELRAVERPFVGVVEMTRQRHERERDLLGQDVRTLPHDLEFVVVDDVDLFEVGEVAPHRRGVHLLVLDHVHVELEILRRDLDVLPFLPGLRVGEIMPQDTLAELDAVGQLVVGERPGLRHAWHEPVDVLVMAFRERVAGEAPEIRHGRVVVDDHVHVAGVRGDRANEAAALLGVFVEELGVASRGFAGNRGAAGIAGRDGDAAGGDLVDAFGKLGDGLREGFGLESLAVNGGHDARADDREHDEAEEKKNGREK